ncbi:MAG: mechanosensitive ion channel [Anaerolineales bacterium]
MDPIIEFFNSTIGMGFVDILLGLLILLIGYILARIIASVIRRVLLRLKLDKRIGEILGQVGFDQDINVVDILTKILFWILMIFVFVAFFEQIGMDIIAGPLTAFLNNITTNYLPSLIAAGFLFFIAWLVATVSRFLVKKAVSVTKLDERLSKHGALENDEKVVFGKVLADAAFWLIMLLFLPAILSSLGIAPLVEPIQSVITDIMNVLPNILAAGIIAVIGFLVARLVKQVVSKLLKSIGADKAGERIGLSKEFSLSNLVGRILYIFILVVTLISAFDQLNIEAISGPTTQMLTTIVDAIPGILSAALVLVVAYAIAKLVSKLVVELLANIGFDRLPEKLGLSWSMKTSPSKFIGYLVLVVVMLFSATTAAELLGSAFLVEALGVFIGFFWQVALAVVVFAIGLYFATLAKNTINKTGTKRSGFVARLAQVAIIVFATSMSLRTLGLANDIINLAFGLVLGGLVVAAALAFGLGGREVAGRELDNFVNKMREKK